MPAQHILWIPPAAMTDGVLDLRLTELASGWSKRWFGGPGNVHVRRLENASFEFVEAPTAEMLTSCGSLRLPSEQADLVKLGAALVHYKAGASKSAPADIQLLRKMGTRALQDFLTGAAEVFGVRAEIEESGQLDTAHAEGPAMRYAISFNPMRRPMALRVDWNAAIRARRLTAGRLDAPARAMGRRADAVARQDINVGAHIGSAKVALSDLSALAPGDVLVLDRALSDSLELTISGQRQTGAKCRLPEQDKPAPSSNQNTAAGGRV
jgi:flagellar motor switch/type III secretory pathway protein FliN